jgi:hypothetical protein
MSLYGADERPGQRHWLFFRRDFLIELDPSRPPESFLSAKNFGLGDIIWLFTKNSKDRFVLVARIPVDYCAPKTRETNANTGEGRFVVHAKRGTPRNSEGAVYYDAWSGPDFVPAIRSALPKISLIEHAFSDANSARRVDHFFVPVLVEHASRCIPLGKLENLDERPDGREHSPAGHEIVLDGRPNEAREDLIVAKELRWSPSLSTPQVEEGIERGEYNPEAVTDARDKVLREIRARRGQRQFRDALIDAYAGRCAITGCSVLDVLEAAHITPYLGPETNHVTNGLLLRADLHTLFDTRLLAVDPDTLKVLVAPSIQDPAYRELHGNPLRTTATKVSAPSVAALRQHRAACDW